MKYGTSFSDKNKTNIQPPSPDYPNNTENTRELMAHYEIMPERDGANYETRQPNRANQQHSSVPDPNKEPRYSNIPVAAPNANFDTIPGQQAQYEYVVHAGQRVKLDESLPTENVPEVRYEVDESTTKDLGTSQQPTNPNREDVDTPREGLKPLVQHYAVSYASPTLTRTMEVGHVCVRMCMIDCCNLSVCLHLIW